MANILTSVRIVCGLLLLAFPAFSKGFYALYIIGGFTDAIDGTAARKLGAETSFGAKYDTAADFIFAAAVFVKIVKAVHFPAWLLLWIGGIFAVKMFNLAVGFLRYRKFVTVHSLPNKICGMACFLLPFFLGGACVWQAKAAGIVFVCLLASGAAVHESTRIFTGRAEACGIEERTAVKGSSE